MADFDHDPRPDTRTRADDGYVLRNLTSVDEVSLVDAVLTDAFGLEGLVDGRPETTVFEPARNTIVEHDGQPVGNLGALTRDVTIPGGVVSAQHLVAGGVRQLHRRRGLMTRLMHHQLHEAREVHREPISLLWATEARIYHRYGYGLASQNVTFAVDKRTVSLRTEYGPDDLDHLRESSPVDVAPVLRAVYEAARPGRPGWSSRDDRWWNQVLEDPPPQFRQGYSALRAAVFDDGHGPQGYAIWRRRQEFSAEIVNGEIQLVEMVATTTRAYAALWRYLLSVDLIKTIRWDFTSTDEPLWLLVDEPRALHATVGDGMWVRLLDLPRALSDREYAAPLDTVIAVEDPIFPANTGNWRLTTTGGVAKCVATTDEPDLTCDLAALGAAYLGGTSLASLAAAGRVTEHRAGALADASTAFRHPIAPSALSLF
jgi:predicted acetyltransferase